MADLAGINLAMQTPFNADGSINFDEWERLIDIYVDAGVHGLVLGAGSGQHPYLTELRNSWANNIRSAFDALPRFNWETAGPPPAE